MSDPMRAVSVTSCNPAVVAGVATRYRDLRDHFAAVLRRLDIPPKEVEGWWRCSRALVGHVLTGLKPLTDEKIAKCPAHVQTALAEEWCADLGLLTGSRAAAIGALQAGLHLLALDSVPMRMAHASLDEPAVEPKKRRA